MKTNQGKKLKKLSYSSDLEWMRPYISKVKHIVPVHKLDRINSYKPREKNIINEHASYNVERLDGRISRIYISLNLYSWKLVKIKPFKRIFIPFSKIDLLMGLAHELAHHTVGFKHTPKHKKLENRLCGIFMTMLENEGYISEEHELKHNKPRS